MLRAGCILAAALVALAACGSKPEIGARPMIEMTKASFADLHGWALDDHEAALATFLRSCAVIAKRSNDASLGAGAARDWKPICADARRVLPGGARSFFEDRFQPVRFGSANDALFTGYYEPEIRGSRRAEGPYQHPIYARPADLDSTSGARYYTRAQIDAGALDGRGLELFYLDDPVESFFLHIQGSGRVRLPDGSVARVGFAGKNGYPYRSIGKILVARGEMTAGQASAQSIKAWVAAHPKRGRALLAENPSFVFFRELPALDPRLGPLGALETPLTPLRSIAVDKSIYPLGAPIWIETSSSLGLLRRLMVAQDVGGAIKGAQRADVFFGSGDKAGRIAGTMKNGGVMVALLPREAARRLIALR